MNIAVLSFTKKGALSNEKISNYLTHCGNKVQSFSVKNDTLPSQIPFSDVKQCVKELFYQVGGLIFIGATGIAVRAIAPLLVSKDKDPAVIVIDETLQFVIPLLSGHIGGANQLATEIANYFSAEAIITTATDRNGVFAVDTFAKKQNLIISEVAKIKQISSALLNGEQVGFYSEYQVQGVLPKGLTTEFLELGIYLGTKVGNSPFKHTFHLIPKNIVVGTGCKKGTKKEALQEFLKEIVKQQNIDTRRIEKICSIDKKADEEGLLLLANDWKVPFQCYSAEELLQAKGEFTASSFVKEQVGVDNVCERSACLGSKEGTMLLKKYAKNGMTVSVWERNVVISFDS